MLDRSLLKRVVLWTTALAGLLLLAGQVVRVLPHENRLILRLPASEVRRVSIDLWDSDQDLIRTIELFPRNQPSGRITQVVSAPVGNYTLSVQYELRTTDRVDKNHGGGWTRVGVQHQIRLEGADYRFPPPKETP